MIWTITWSKNKNGNNFVINILAGILAGIWMIVGYYITEVILYGNWLSQRASIPRNVA